MGQSLVQCDSFWPYDYRVLVCFTANHRNARFDVLEALAAQPPRTTQALLQAGVDVFGAVVVSTCNRFEVYLDVADSASVESIRDSVIETLSESTGVPSRDLLGAVATLSGADVVPHLFGVTAGLKSVVIGEDEIAGQVRRCLEHSRRDGTSSPGLERLFQTASRTSKTVKSQTALGHADRSLVRLALELAESRIADWSEARVLLIGTGQYAATTVAALRERGVQDITVYSPSGRAGPFALRHSLTAAAELPPAAAASDVIITCTSREHPVVTPATVDNTTGRTLIIDLGLPRNVAPAVEAVPGIELLDLETIRLHAPLEELNATRDAHTVVDHAASRFGAAEAERNTAPAIIALRKHIIALLDAELERSRQRGSWTPASEADLRHLVGVILHAPSMRARELARDGDGHAFVAGLSAVFGIEASPAAVVAADAEGRVG